MTDKATVRPLKRRKKETAKKCSLCRGAGFLSVAPRFVKYRCGWCEGTGRAAQDTTK